MPGVYTDPRQLFVAEMSTLAHLSWIIVPAVLVLGGVALTQFVRREGRVSGRYGHAAAVVLLWLIYIGAQFYVGGHPAWAKGGVARDALDAAAVTLVVGSLAGLTLRHTKPERHRTPRVLAIHLGMALGTAVLLIWGLFPYH